MVTRVIVEGWRFLPHSYAIVNQWQLLSLTRRADVAVKITDAPPYRPDWKAETGLFTPEQEEKLRAIERTGDNERADTTLRIFMRSDFSPSRSDRTAVFGTCECQLIQRKHLRDPALYDAFQQGSAPRDIVVITPSRWSAEGYYRAGFGAERVHIIPHGIDIDCFHPMPDIRGKVRQDMDIAHDDFVFLTVGAMTGNKGMDLLLQGFANACRKHSHARLILKGLDPLYRSSDLLSKAMSMVPVPDQQRIVDRISYFGQSFSFREMAMLYQAADAYVSPYRAEGFNMPVLEAIACGLPVICTGGGATDDFVNPESARKIYSKPVEVSIGGEQLVTLQPDLEHLTALMISAIEDTGWRHRAAEAGPLHVRKHYRWDDIVNKLVNEVL